MGYKDKQKQKEYQRQWVAKRRAEYFADKCCVVCGSIVNLELDHIDPATKDPRLRSGTGLWSWSKENREKEIAKCQVLCEYCHDLKTIEFMSRDYTHGSHEKGYSRGCRCEDCRSAHAEYNLKWRAAKKLASFKPNSDGVEQR